MRVLVTGHRGYIGSVLVGVLKNARCDVVGLDCDFYADCDFGRVQDGVPSFDIDVRDIEFTDLLSFDAVIHLADLPEAASSGLDPNLVGDITEQATLRLAECCKRADVSRLLFASSCSVYGRAGGALLDEDGRVDPISAHAAAKLRCERALLPMADASFAPVVLRNAMTYGVSSRMRLDLPVNDLVASALVTGKAALNSDGRAWKPLIHVEDLARAYASALTADADIVRGRVFNVVSSDENHRMITVADLVTELVPWCSRSTARFTFDEPSCRIDGSRFAEAFPKFEFRWTLPDGIRQLRNALTGAGLTPGEWRSDRYRRVLQLETLLDQGRITSSLRKVDVERVGEGSRPLYRTSA